MGFALLNADVARVTCFLHWKQIMYISLNAFLGKSSAREIWSYNPFYLAQGVLMVNANNAFTVVNADAEH